MGKAWVPVHTSNLYVSEVTDSYSYNEETIYVNDFTAEYQAGLCKTYIDDLIAEKGKENITWEVLIISRWNLL